ncbi:hypothetical protein Barb4_04020 [Bacteroidales bacterium Barb4]|nr:hypothetical protein Barb4_04020 [Bacteroidales bacterium Barb4]
MFCYNSSRVGRIQKIYYIVDDFSLRCLKYTSKAQARQYNSSSHKQVDIIRKLKHIFTLTVNNKNDCVSTANIHIISI